MNLTRNITNKVKCICQITRGRIYSIIEKYNLTEKQLDDFTLKLDILGRRGNSSCGMAGKISMALSLDDNYQFCILCYNLDNYFHCERI